MIIFVRSLPVPRVRRVVTAHRSPRGCAALRARLSVGSVSRLSRAPRSTRPPCADPRDASRESRVPSPLATEASRPPGAPEPGPHIFLSTLASVFVRGPDGRGAGPRRAALHVPLTYAAPGPRTPRKKIIDKLCKQLHTPSSSHSQHARTRQRALAPHPSTRRGAEWVEKRRAQQRHSTISHRRQTRKHGQPAPTSRRRAPAAWTEKYAHGAALRNTAALAVSSAPLSIERGAGGALAPGPRCRPSPSARLGE